MRKPDFRGYGSVSPNLAWQRLGSHVARFVWNRRLGPAALPQVALDLFWMFGCFCSQITANSVIAKSEIQGFLPRP
jgi:hypothetical protein